MFVKYNIIVAMSTVKIQYVLVQYPHLLYKFIWKVILYHMLLKQIQSTAFLFLGEIHERINLDISTYNDNDKQIINSL